MGLVALWHVETWTKDGTYVPCTGRQILIHWTTPKVPGITFLSTGQNEIKIRLRLLLSKTIVWLLQILSFQSYIVFSTNFFFLTTSLRKVSTQGPRRSQVFSVGPTISLLLTSPYNTSPTVSTTGPEKHKKSWPY